MRTEVVRCKKRKAGVVAEPTAHENELHNVLCQRTRAYSILSNSYTDISVFLSSRL